MKQRRCSVQQKGLGSWNIIGNTQVYIVVDKQRPGRIDSPRVETGMFQPSPNHADLSMTYWELSGNYDFKH